VQEANFEDSHIRLAAEQIRETRVDDGRDQRIRHVTAWRRSRRSVWRNRRLGLFSHKRTYLCW